MSSTILRRPWYYQGLNDYQHLYYMAISGIRDDSVGKIEAPTVEALPLHDRPANEDLIEGFCRFVTDSCGEERKGAVDAWSGYAIEKSIHLRRQRNSAWKQKLRSSKKALQKPYIKPT